MTEIIQRWLVSLGLIGMAAFLVYVGEPVWSLLPAAAGVYVAGSLLLDVWREKR